MRGRTVQGIDNIVFKLDTISQAFTQAGEVHGKKFNAVVD
jgi:hypothetical protein